MTVDLRAFYSTKIQFLLMDGKEITTISGASIKRKKCFSNAIAQKMYY